MRFNVPQFIDVEDKIIGPLSLKQFFVALFGALALIFLWYFFQLWFVLLLGIPLAIAVIAFIFLKINGRPFTAVVSAWFNYYLNPRTYIWKKTEKNNPTAKQ